MSPKYRPDIDGLRTIAVLPVVLYHAGFPGFGGGFIGVDVFFVISGYLITTIIHREILDGSFSVLKFYERRARRILPALFAMLLAVFAVAWLILLPSNYGDFAKTALATLGFVSNFWFWRYTGDYFSDASEFMPLLNTWSLAVEEQFYIFFPLLLLALMKWARGAAKPILAATVLASLALAIWATPREPIASFYLLPTRAWELGFGVLLALGIFPRSAPRAMREGLAGLGLAAILLPVAFYTASTPFPGLAALPPVAGAALLIWAGIGGTTAVGRLLSLRPFVFVGLISYSLYLWHWPILALARQRLADVELEAPVAAAAVALSMLMAVLSWRFVERPFRKRGPGGIAAPGIVAFSVGGTAALGACAAAIVAASGVPQRFDPARLALLPAMTEPYPQAPACGGARGISRLCAFGDTTADGPATWLLWGDSHAKSVMPALETLAQEAGRKAVFASKNGCAPLPGLRQTDETHAGNVSCNNFRNAVLDYARSDPDLKVVVLAVRWPLYVEGRKMPGEGGKPITLYTDHPPGLFNSGPRNNAALAKAALSDLLQQLAAAGKTVVVLGPIPEIGWDAQLKLQRFILFGDAMPPDPRRTDVEARQKRSVDMLTELTGQNGIWLAQFTPEICTDSCPTHTGNRSYYFDDDHLSPLGADTFLVPVLRRVFRQSLATLAD